MRDLFPGWVPPDEETLDRYWTEGTFAVDTSVLLDLYRFSEETRKGLLKALRSFGERLWIPHQVGLEFHRNRLGVLLDQREAENNLLRELDALRQNLDQQLSQLLRGAGRRDLAPLRDAIDGGFDSLREKLKEAEKEHTKGLGDSIREDPIYEEVMDLCEDRVGSPYEGEQEAAVIKDAEERFKSKIPPGYLDAGKEDEAKYGDVILWHQLCLRASETKKPVVLIADDQKADWVWEVKGKKVGPRPELVAEMSEKAGVGFHIYSPTRFLQIWEKREEGRDVEPEVLAEIEGSAKDAVVEAKPSLLQRFMENYASAASFSGENQRKPRASHSLGPEGVELMLEYPPLQIPEKTPRVTIRDPKGDSVSTSPGPTYSGILGQGIKFLARYPDHFPGAESLSPGSYEVNWEIVNLLKDEGKITALTKHLATDVFVIGPGEAGR